MQQFICLVQTVVYGSLEQLALLKSFFRIVFLLKNTLSSDADWFTKSLVWHKSSGCEELNEDFTDSIIIDLDTVDVIQFISSHAVVNL